MEEDGYFGGFHENEDVTSKDDEDYMDALNNITVICKDVSQFLVW